MEKLIWKSKSNIRHCRAINCNNNRDNRRDLSFFVFPKDSARCQKWAQNSWRTDLMSKGVDYLHKNCVLCSDHFEMPQFMNKKKNRLIWKAVPTLFNIPNTLPSILGKSPSLKTKQFKPPRTKKQVLTTEMDLVHWSRTDIKEEPGDGIELSYAMVDPAPDCQSLKMETIEFDYEDSSSSVCTDNDDMSQGIEHEDMDEGSFSCKTAIKTEPGVEVDQNYTYTYPASDFLTVEIKTIKEENEVSPSSSFNDRNPEEIGSNDQDKDLNNVICENIVDLTFSKNYDKIIGEMDVNSCGTQQTIEMPHIEVNDQKTLKCNVCQKSFTGIGYLTKHMNGKVYECEDCNRSLSNGGNLSRHIRVHTNEQSFECVVCYKNFTQKGHFTRHMRIHTNKKRFECNVCHKFFTRRGHLATHMLLHTDEKPFECEICHKCFARKESMKVHLRIHTDEKPYECDVCHKNFRHRGNLVTHMRLHTNVKPFECNICHVCFTEIGCLTSHMQIHSKEKPFQCEICNKCFTQQTYLKAHANSHK